MQILTKEQVILMVKEAYKDGWHDGRNTTSVTGDPFLDWDESETKSMLESDYA